MTAVELIYFNAGGGHRAAARALEAVLQQRYPHWDVRTTNLFEIVDPREQFRRVTSMAPEDFYNRQLALGWSIGLEQQLRVLQAAVRAGHGFLVRRLRDYWERTRPDLVVSLIPNFNRPLHDGLRSALPAVPYVTVMTDLADFPPHFWVEPGTSQVVVCGTEHARSQALAAGMPADQLRRVSGMIVRPDFYDPLPPDAVSRADLGLEPGRPTGIVMFGGHGSMAMQKIARQLPDVQLILICGHNQALARRLRSNPAGPGHAVVEFTPHVRQYMGIADFFIGKPGPGSISEAVQQGLPVITTRNRWTMPQERYNADWVREQRLGIVVRSTGRIGGAVRELLPQLQEFKANVARIDNRAVFEVPDILAEILGEPARDAAAASALLEPVRVRRR